MLRSETVGQGDTTRKTRKESGQVAGYHEICGRIWLGMSMNVAQFQTFKCEFHGFGHPGKFNDFCCFYCRFLIHGAT
jgi:hypothetical protein